MTKLRSRPTGLDHQQLQAQREQEIILNRRLVARDVVALHARIRGWSPDDVDQVIAMLGLDQEPGLLGASGWSGFNNKAPGPVAHIPPPGVG